MKLPKKIKIAGYDIKVSHEPDDRFFGHYDQEEKQILFREGSSSIEDLDTGLHEVLHAIVNIYKIPIPSEEHEEAIVSMMATGLVQVMRDNKQLMKFINDALKI